MIGKVTKGADVRNLIHYLYGPGRRNEHVDPHLVAGYRHPMALEPDIAPNGRRDLRSVVDALRSPVETMRHTPPASPVWHCSLRSAPDDRFLTDEEWADIAEEVMHRTGIAPRGDPDACRWIAVRHADDHIHVVATLARQDGRRADIRKDYFKVRAACQAVEVRYGLSRTAPADRTAAPRPTRAETERAQREGLREPPRGELRRRVAAVAAGAADEEMFFTGLREGGLLVRLRYSAREPEQVTGYAVASPDYRSAVGRTVYFSGGKLAPDLTLPKLRRRWAGPSGIRRTLGREMNHAERAAMYRDAANVVAGAAWRMRASDDPLAQADIASAASDALHVVAAFTGDRRLAAAADSYDRAAREPYGWRVPRTRTGEELRAAARGMAACLMRAATSGRRRPDWTVELLMLIGALAVLVGAVAFFRLAQQRTAQAAAASRAADELEDISKSMQPTLRHVAGPKAAVQLAARDFPMPFGGTPSAGESASRPQRGAVPDRHSPSRR
ncbi:relaxase/mobilization nuclease domain-containing protein [Actinomadura macrotermitis]|uniref:MobA/VirD2-like nuclease domain-containing protein n=1 Tax=Actinomadura macrotermitis TaxID=2585200 RepID=A0A7K0BYI4_9ACTN|nr:relaxase/mobilization nuclease domain-containing protein [Actinomadura macrotermitis]MQY06239.1 hypothetical protein [Actinomadura macrotermitis]